MNLSPEEREWVQGQWRSLLAREHVHFMALCDVDEAIDGWTEGKSLQTRQYWDIISELFRLYVDCDAKGIALQPFPSRVFLRFANLAEELSNGHVSALIENAKGPGKKLHRHERRAIACAIFYIEAVRRGEIADRSEVKTISLAYGVTRKAVQGWIKRRDELTAGISVADWPPGRLVEQMRSAAQRYTVYGRGIGVSGSGH